MIRFAETVAICCLSLLCSPVFAKDAPKHVCVVIETTLGNIEVQLEPEHAPISTANFLRYVDGGFYDDGLFYRTVTLANQPNNTVKIQVIQGGVDPAAGKKVFPPIHLETTAVTGLRHHDGTISMARDGADTATSEFFVCLGDQPALDYGGARNPDGQGFAAFGHVIKGMDIVRKIQASPSDGQSLTPPVRIMRVRREH